MARQFAAKVAIRTIDVHRLALQSLLPFFETSVLQKITLPSLGCVMAFTVDRLRRSKEVGNY